MAIRQFLKQSFIYQHYKYAKSVHELRKWTDRDQVMLNFYAKFISPGDLSFDVGANIGNRTKRFLRIGAKVIAVEPQEDCTKVLRAEFSGNPLFYLITDALGQMEGEAEFFIADGNTISSFSKEWIQAVKNSGRFTNNTWDNSRTVRMTTLDELFKKFGTPQFIKIDVEGYESAVLEGLSTPVKYLSIEFTPEYRTNTKKCLSHLSSLGRVSTNYSIGESFKLIFDDWISCDELERYLDQFQDNSKTWGDIYIRFE